jgi:hypothetical protein
LPLPQHFEFRTAKTCPPCEFDLRPGEVGAVQFAALFQSVGIGQMREIVVGLATNGGQPRVFILHRSPRMGKSVHSS